MILTYKIKHLKNFSSELAKARQVAEFAIKRGYCTSAAVRHIGLKSAISGQILRKYGGDKKIKRVSRVNLTISGQVIKFNSETKMISVPCLSLTLYGGFIPPFEKINQIECNKDYAFVSVTIQEQLPTQPESWIGVDLNATGHCAVASCPSTGKVLKLGKKAQHTHLKYKQIRRHLQKAGKYKVVKKIKNRESCIVRDLNHKISKKIVSFARENNAGIVLEELKGIRKTKKQAKSFRYSLNSWSFFQLATFIMYKAKLLGIPVIRIDPRYTSQQCSKCGLLGIREGKSFKCPACGHVENADVNAAFTIALRHQGILQLPIVREIGKGRIGTPQEATL